MIKGFDSSENTPLWNSSLAEDLRRFLIARLGCAEAAADLTHETYLRLQQRDNENPPENLRALAFHIAMQLVIDFHRKVAVRKRYVAEDSDEGMIEQASADCADPEQILSARQRIEILRAALDELPPDCRTVFLLHGVEGLKYAEIAERLGISISMVGKHLSRALVHCAKRLEK